MAIIIFLWLLFAVGVAFFASLKGRSPAVWFLVGLVISPLIAVVILAVVPSGDEQAIAAPPRSLLAATGSEVLTRLEELFDRGALGPLEAARIKVLAARELPPPPAVVAKSQPTAFTHPCPRCGGLIHPQATTCMHCWAKLATRAA